MKRRDLMRHLRDHNCELIREGGNHSWWGNLLNGRRTAVPRHNEISNFLVKKICRDLGIEEP
ncbi:MAG TPA: addiction module toxin, HicA family [Planctomycetaceae bacterium]|nr:addiction module toxin, HicA family [Planctomycetaceae bacterium]